MKLNFFQTENRPYYAATIWIDDYTEEWFFTTKREAENELKKMKERFPTYSDAYVRHYDKNGCVYSNA